MLKYKYVVDGKETNCDEYSVRAKLSTVYKDVDFWFGRLDSVATVDGGTVVFSKLEEPKEA